MTDSITLKPRAKINLALAVTGKRADGYHELDGVMQTLTLHDTLTLTKTDGSSFEFTTDSASAPAGEDNLVCKAVKYMLEHYSIQSGVRVELNKNIPVAAGLGGGSADCAAALTGMRDLFGLPVTDGELMEMAAVFGADVPFFIMGGTARARGIGELLTPLTAHPDVYILVARPPVYVSTADVFGRFKFGGTKKPDVERVVEGLYKNDLTLMVSGMANELETVTEAMYPQITRVKRVMYDRGALVAQMSGSGPCVFGYFLNDADARAAAEAVRTAEGIEEIFLTGAYDRPGIYKGEI